VACLAFETLLAPYGEAFFLEEVLGQSALYVTGDPSKFSDLYSWSDLNRLLTFGGLGYPRLRLIGGGQELPADSYLRPGVSGYPRPLNREVNSALRDGAMLAVESIEELNEPISRLCEVLEQRIEVPVQADLYAYFHDKTPAAVRWNEHDVIVLQLEGEKAWRVYCPTAASPTEDCFPPGPAGDPAWEGVLQAGSVLYIPAGWWYCDQTTAPALCLALKFRNLSGVDVLHRLVDRLTKSNGIRADCPRFGGPDKQSAFLKAFQMEVMTACTSPGLLLGFLKDFKTFSEPRVGFNLPWSAAPEPLPPSDDLLVLPLLRFPRADSVRHAQDEDAAELPVGGGLIRFPEDAGKIMSRVCIAPALSVRGLFEAFASEMPRERILESLSGLVKAGVVEFRESPEDGT
jgi:hypothetical protein